MERHVDEVLRVKGREVASISPEATVLAAVRSMNEKRSMSVVMVTHDTFAGTYGHRTVRLKDGRIVHQAGEMARPREKKPDEGQVVPFRRRSD